MIFQDRQDAGERLAEKLSDHKGGDGIVLALPRGGVIMGAEVAEALEMPLGLVLVRKIGHPLQPEFAIGAVAEDGPAVYDRATAATIDRAWLKRAEAEERKLVRKRRRHYYGKDFEPPAVTGKLVILVDDGIATGLTMQAAIQAVRDQGAKRVIVAVPVAPADAVAMLQPLADEIVVLDDPAGFMGSVGAHYDHFEQVGDAQVRATLRGRPP